EPNLLDAFDLPAAAALDDLRHGLERGARVAGSRIGARSGRHDQLNPDPRLILELGRLDVLDETTVGKSMPADCGRFSAGSYDLNVLRHQNNQHLPVAVAFWIGAQTVPVVSKMLPDFVRHHVLNIDLARRPRANVSMLLPGIVDDFSNTGGPISG